MLVINVLGDVNAKTNGVNVYQYLKLLLEKQPNNRMSGEELERFTPWNPAVKALLDSRAASEESEVLPDFHGRNNLLAEDNELNRETAKSIFEINDFAVTCTEDGQETTDTGLTWSGSWWPDGPKSSPEAYVQGYHFCLDVITGEPYYVFHDRVLDKNTDSGLI